MNPIAAAAAAYASVGIACQAFGVTHLRRGEVPPSVVLTAVDGAAFDLAQKRDRPVVLLFGELYHDASIEACRIVAGIAADSRLADTPPTCVLIAAQQAEPGVLRDAARQRQVGISILHDRQRRVFAAYQVSVLPSVVVIDRQGRVVHAAASLSPAFRDVVLDAVLFAAGRITAEQLDATLRPASRPVLDDSTLRATRLVELGRQLARSGLGDLAADKFREALALDPACVAARVELGGEALRRHDFAVAEKHYQAALAVDPGYAEAALGLAYVQTLRGGGELPAAEQRVRALLGQRPNDPEAHYLLGLIHEQAGRSGDAAASYRKAAELLLERGNQTRIR